MPLLHRLAEGFAAKYGQKVDDFAFGLARAIPSANGAEREMGQLHAAWVDRAELHRSYYSIDAKYVWLGDGGWSGPVRLACIGEVTFVRRGDREIYTADGQPSWRYFFAAGPQGLTTAEPPKPPKGQDFFIQGDLRDAEHPERWEITLH